MIPILVQLDQHGVRFLLIGGRGLEAHGYVRNTLDLGLLVLIDGLDELSSLLRQMGFEKIAETPIFSRWRSPDAATEDLDLLYVDSATFEKLDADAVSMDLGGCRVRVPSVAGMIALKLHAMRSDPDRGVRDSEDVRALLRLHPEALDLAEFRSLCERYGPSGVFETLRPDCP